MNDKLKLLIATLMGAALMFAITGFTEQASNKRPAYRDICSEQLGLLFSEMNDLNRRLATSPSTREILDKDQDTRNQAQILVDIDRRLSELEISVHHVEAILQFPPVR